ncbi:MAG TPA: XrtA system polysaccharide chain length determinant [Vicinamibacterales bacterium]
MASDPFIPSTDESFAFRAIDIFRRRKVLVTFVFMAVLASAVTFALCLPDLYKSSAVLLVERPVPEVYVRPAVSGELESRLHVIKQEIMSRARLTDLINRFNLYPDLRRQIPMDGVLDQMRHDIDIELTGPEQVSGRKTTVSFKLSYTGGNGERVSKVTNELANFYVSQNDEIRSQEATRATGFLRAQLDATRKELDNHEASMRAYTSSHPGELPQQVEVNLAALERLNTQLRLTGEREIKLLEDREKLTDGLAVTTDYATGTSSFVGDPPVNERLERMKRDLKMLEGQFTSRHPDVIRMKTEIAAAERQQQDALLRERQAAQKTADGAAAAAAVAQNPTALDARKKALQNLDAELEKLKKEEADLRGNISGIENRLQGVPERQQEFGRLTRDYNAAKDLYDSLLKRYDDAQLAASMETDRQGERFRILEAAMPPSSPVAPNRNRLMIMGFLMALIVAAGAALAAEQFDTTFHSVDDLREFTRVPVLGAVSPIATVTAGRTVKFALATVSAVAVIWIIVVLSTHAARGNEQLVWMLARGA